MTENTIENPGRTMWRGAARDGGIIGLILLATMLINAFSDFRLASVIGVINFVVLAGCIYVFARRRSMIYGAAGFSFAQSMGYIVLMMIFTGIITGIGDYLAVNIISPDYFEGTLDQVFDSNPLISARPDLFDDSIKIVRTLLKNPFYHIIMGVTGKIIYGGIIGLFVSAFVKRPPMPQPFSNEK